MLGKRKVKHKAPEILRSFSTLKNSLLPLLRTCLLRAELVYYHQTSPVIPRKKPVQKVSPKVKKDLPHLWKPWNSKAREGFTHYRFPAAFCGYSVHRSLPHKEIEDVQI